MAKATTRLTTDALAFLTERHLAMLTTLRLDNSPHVVAVGFTFDPKTHTARVITTGGSQKAVNAAERGVAVLSQVDGARWLSLEGRATVNSDINAVRDAELRYAQRYRTPRANPRRVVIEVRIERVLGSSELLERGDGDAKSQFKTLVSAVVAQNLRSQVPTRTWRADDGTVVSGWRIEQIDSFRNSENPAPGKWYDDWLDADYVLSTNGAIYEYRFWSYEDDHTAKESGRTLTEVPSSELAGRQGPPFGEWTKKIQLLKSP
jgi:PPOX class probable F420-dependent enzyme